MGGEVEWIYLAEGRDEWLAVVNAILKQIFRK
jgi:hypothetical protein